MGKRKATARQWVRTQNLLEVSQKCESLLHSVDGESYFGHKVLYANLGDIMQYRLKTTRWHLSHIMTVKEPEGVGGMEIIGLPFLGELWGEVGGEESWEEALDTVSSGCLRCLSFPSSDKDRIFFRDWGELVPVDICKKISRISMRNTAIPQGCWDAKLHCLGFYFFCICMLPDSL